MTTQIFEVAYFKVFKMLEQLIDFLLGELDIPTEAIFLAQKSQNIEPNTLPIVLWQYGFLNIRQLDRVFEWLELS